MEWWFYEKNGKRVGPVSQGELRRLHAFSDINDSTLVWHADACKVWVPFATSGASHLGTGQPPPLPVSHVNATYAWLLAIVPLIGLFVENVAQSSLPNFTRNTWLIFASYVVVNTVLGLLDERLVEASGRNGRGFRFDHSCGSPLVTSFSERAPLAKSSSSLRPGWCASSPLLL